MAFPSNYRTLSLVFLLAIIVSGSCFARTYTTNADFEEGILLAVQDISVPNQLQLESFMWVPNNNGTVSKVGTATGRELGRYRVVPSNLPLLPSGDANFGFPSPTAVGTDGSCWIGNRTAGTVVKIGLLEAGQFIDRNGNGTVQTSRDLNNDGVITGSEILSWGEDECVLYEVVLVPGHEGAHYPGTYAGPYDPDDDAGTSPRALALDSSNNLWVGSWGLSKYFRIIGATTSALPSQISIDRTVDVAPHTPFGAVIDRFGIMWSVGRDGFDVLRMDISTNPPSLCTLVLPHISNGIALDQLDHLFVTGFSQSQLSRIAITNLPCGSINWTKSAPGLLGSRGAVCTNDNDVWVANAFADTVTRYDNEGNLKATIAVGFSPSGVAVDADGKVWVCDFLDEAIWRIDPGTNATDIKKELPGTMGHYSNGGMTDAPTDTGTWTVVHDSGKAGCAWDRVSWNDQPGDLDSGVYDGSTLAVTIQSSDDNVVFSAAETAGNGVRLKATPPGRYLKVVVSFQRQPGAKSPVLYDLTVTPCGDLEITKQVSCSPDSGYGATVNALRGALVYFKVEVANAGCDDLRDVVITDILTDPNGSLLPCTSCTDLSDGSIISCIPGAINVGYLPSGAKKAYRCALQTNPAFALTGTAIDATNSASVTGTAVMSGLTVSKEPISATVNVLVPKIECAKYVSATTDFSGHIKDLQLVGNGPWSVFYQLSVVNTGDVPVDFTKGDCAKHFADTLLDQLPNGITIISPPDMAAAFLSKMSPNGILAANGTVSVVVETTFNGTLLCSQKKDWSNTFSACGFAIGIGICLPDSEGETVSTGECSAVVRINCSSPKLLQAYCGLTCPDNTARGDNTVFLGFKGRGIDTITAVPGVFAIDSGANWANFVSAAAAGIPYTVTNISMRKNVPTYVCTVPIGGKPTLQQGSANIRKWWPLVYELPGTKWTLTIWYKTAKWDDDGTGPNPPGTNHQNVWTWEVDATLDSLEGLVRLFHELPAGSCQVPLISSESLYVELLSNIETLRGMSPSDPEMAEVFISFILLLEDNCLTVDCGACVSELGIRNTVENPACCKLLADADYIAEALGVYK